MRKNVASQKVPFLLISATDGSALTGATVSAYVSKDGAAQAAAGGSVSELANGQYVFAPSQGDTNCNSLGILLTASGAIPQHFTLYPESTDRTDAVRGGMTALPNAAAGANTGLPVVGTQVPNATAGASGGLPTVDSTNSVKIQAPLKRNTALNNFEFVMYDTLGIPATGLTVTGTRSIDGGAPASTTNSVTEVTSGAGRYKINFAAGDLNGTIITFVFSATAAKDTCITIPTLP